MARKEEYLDFSQDEIRIGDLVLILTITTLEDRKEAAIDRKVTYL